MCDDCYDSVVSENIALEDQISNLKDQVALLTYQGGVWKDAALAAESVLYKMHRLAVEAPFERDERWGVYADDIEELYNAWVEAE